MGLETGSYIADLIVTNPTGTDPKSAGDNHLRLLKTALRNCFAGFTGAIFVTGTDGGAVNAYTLTPTTELIAYSTKMECVFAPTITNTGACTLNVSGLGVRNIKSVSGADLVAGDLVASNLYAAFYNGTEWRLLSVTKNYVDQVAFNTALPAQPGGTYFTELVSYNGVASFRGRPFVRSPRTSNAILTDADCGTLIDVTSGTFTQTLTAVASMQTYWHVYYQNSGSGVITIDPNGSEPIDGQTIRVCYPGEIIKLYKDETAAAFRCFVIRPFYLKCIAGITYAHPSGYIGVDLDLVGGAGGAGSGRKGAAGTTRQGGSPGGAPGRVKGRVLLTANTSVTVSIGAAGTPGASQTVDSTDGTDGTAGGNTTFGTYLTAYGGCAGIGGKSDSSKAGQISGSGSISAGTAAWAGSTITTAGGNPTVIGSTWGANLGSTPHASHEYGGAGAYAFTVIGNSVYGGAASASGDTSGTTPTGGGYSRHGVAGGGFGGWVTSGNTAVAGGTGGITGAWTGTGAIGGTSGAAPTVGANGAANAGTDFDMGNPGAGGGSTATAGVDGKAGGNGTFPGGPGGGGGACTNGVGNSGPGGTSQGGQAIIMGVL